MWQCHLGHPQSICPANSNERIRLGGDFMSGHAGDLTQETIENLVYSYVSVLVRRLKPNLTLRDYRI